MPGKRIFMNILININSIGIVFIGGGIGASLRYLISLIIKNDSIGFPFSTFVVNIVGCFLIGLFYSMAHFENLTWRLFLIVGVLGGFTTFSTYGYDTIQLFAKGQVQTALLYVILSNICGLTAVFIGTKITLLYS